MQPAVAPRDVREWKTRVLFAAPVTVRGTLQVKADGAFTVPVALLRGMRGA